MGCIFELLYEIVFEIFGEYYINLMTMVIPPKKFYVTTESKLRKLLTVYAVALVLLIIAGLVMVLQNKKAIQHIGGYFLYIPMGLIIVQILTGLAVRAAYKDN